MTTLKPINFAVLAVLLLAAAMRFGGAGHNGAWSDEGWNIWLVRDVSAATIIDRLVANHHPPAYFLSLAAWREIAGESRLALRFLSIAAGMLCVALIYRIGVDHFGHNIGLAAAVLFAVFEQPVYYGQSMRHYAFLVLGVCLTLFFFLRTLKRPRMIWLIGYALSAALMMLSMYLGALILAVQGFVGLFLWRTTRHHKLHLIAAWVGMGLLLAPWLMYALPQQWSKVERGVITGYHNSFTTSPTGIVTMTDLLLGGQAALGIALCGLAMWGLLRSRVFQDGTDGRIHGFAPTGHPAGVTVILSGIGVFAVMLALNLRLGILAERTLFFLTPAILLTLGIGLQAVQRPAREFLLVALVGWAILTPQNVVPRINADQAAQVVASGYTPGDFVLLETGFDDAVFQYEMRLALQPDPTEGYEIFRSFWEYDFPGDGDMLNALDAALQDETRVWLVYWNVPQRMAERLEAMGFTNQGVFSIPTGANDPLYELYPTIAVMFYARPEANAAVGIFGDLFELKDAQTPAAAHAGEALHVDLWWSALQPPDRDYSVGVFLLDADGITRLEHFGPNTTTPTSGWQVGDVIFDRHTLALPSDLPSGDYSIIANIYWYETPSEPLAVDGESYARLGMVQITTQ